MKKLLPAILLVIFSLFIVTPAYAQADFSGPCQEQGVATLIGITCVVKNILKPLPGIIALAALAMIIWAGIRVINSGADPKAYAGAMATLQYAIIGIILLSASWFILVLIERFTGAPVTQFGVPQ